MRDILAACAIAAVLVTACRQPPPPSAASVPFQPRRLGAWSGSGNTTLGFVSESGSFHIAWQAKDKDPARPGSFQLVLRSGISGRPMKVIADVQGTASGTLDFGDDPRMYEFLVESNGIDWAVTVDDTFAAPKDTR